MEGEYFKNSAEQVLLNEERSFLERTFSKMGEGSIRGSIFTVLSIGIGAGALSMPFAIAQTGVLLGVIILVFSAFLALWSLKLLVLAAEKEEIRDLVQLTKKVYGKKAQKFVQVTQLVFLAGCCISFQVIVAQLMQFLLFSFFENPEINSYKTYVYTCLITNYLIILPLSLKENLHDFRYISLISLASIVYVTLLILIQLPDYYEKNYTPERLILFNWDLKEILKTFAICVFGFGVHNHALPIYDELYDRSKRRMGKVLDRSILTMFMIYLFIGVGGYFSTFEKTTKIVIIRELAVNNFGNWLAVQFAVFALILLILIHSPVVYHPSKQIIFRAFLNKDNSQVKKDQNMALCLFFFSFIVLIAILFPNITSILSIIGGLAGATLCFLVPTFLFVETHKNEISQARKFVYQAIGLVTGGMGYASVVVTLI